MLGRVAAAFLALAIGGLARPALAIQCDKATARPDKLICTDPALRSADAAMSAAYESLHATLPKTEQPGLRADQRQWLSERAACIVDTDGKAVADAAAIACMRTSTEARRTFLDGRAPGEPKATPRITPRFLYRPRTRGHYEVEIAYPVIAGADTPALKAVNALLRRTAIGDWAGPRSGDGDRLMHQVGYRVTLATSRFASIDFSTYDDGDAAYPTTGGTALNIDFATGKVLPLVALLRPGAINSAIKLCTAQLTAYYSNALSQSWQPPAPGVHDVANDGANWSTFSGPFDPRLPGERLRPRAWFLRLHDRCKSAGGDAPAGQSRWRSLIPNRGTSNSRRECSSCHCEERSDEPISFEVPLEPFVCSYDRDCFFTTFLAMTLSL